MKYIKQKHAGNFSYIAFCQSCGNFFHVRDRTDAKSRKFCNRNCVSKAQKTSITKICANCGNEYSVWPSHDRAGSKYCSVGCASKAMKTGEYRICPICNNEFYVIKAKIKKGEGKYCSKECANKSLEKRIKIRCAYCDKENEVHPSRLKNKKDYFCNMDCYYKSLPKKLVKNCVYCGEEFLTQPSVDRIFCNDICQQKANKDKKIERICKHCGKTFLAYKHAVNKGFGIYCDNECMYKGQSGEGASSWRGGVSFEPYCYKFNEKLKERVRNFWNRECAICAKTEKENGRKMSVHHVNYNKMSCCDGTPPLFIPVCQSCHAKTNLNRNWWEHILTEYIMVWYDGESYLPE